MKILNKYKIIIYLILILLAGGVLRFYRLTDDFVFLFDQGRDLLVVDNIIHGRLTLLGQQMGIEGIYYGSLYYYFLAPFLFLSKGNPVFLSIVIILINLLGIYLIFSIGKRIANYRVGLIAAFLSGISYSLIAFSRWLTNPSLVPPLSLLFLYFLIGLKKNNKLFWAIGLLIGIVFQLESPVAVFYPLILLAVILVDKIRLRVKDLLGLFCSFLFIMLPQITFEVRHDFLSTRGLFKLFFQERVFKLLTPETIGGNLEIYLSIFSDLLTPSARFLTIVLFIGSTVFLIQKLSERKEKNSFFKILSFLIYIPLIIMLFYSRPFTPGHLIGVFPIYILLVSLFIDFLGQKKPLLIVFFLVIFGFLNVNKYILYENYVNFCPNINKINLLTQKKVIDYLYTNSGKSFNYIAYTIPYWKDEPWQYLFFWYGKSKYGYLPKKGEAEIFYLIIEGDPENPAYLSLWRKQMDEKSKIIAKEQLGSILIEKRALKDI